MASKNSVRMSISLPDDLYIMILQEAKDSGESLATIIRKRIRFGYENDPAYIAWQKSKRKQKEANNE